MIVSNQINYPGIKDQSNEYDSWHLLVEKSYVSSGLPRHGGLISNVSSCRGFPYSRQPSGHAGEATNGW